MYIYIFIHIYIYVYIYIYIACFLPAGFLLPLPLHPEAERETAGVGKQRERPVFKAHRPLYHSTLGSRVMKK